VNDSKFEIYVNEVCKHIMDALLSKEEQNKWTHVLKWWGQCFWVVIHRASAHWGAFGISYLTILLQRFISSVHLIMSCLNDHFNFL